MLYLSLLLVGLVRDVCAQNKWEFYSFSSQPGAVAYGRLDPIISPGAVSEHVHMFHGSDALGATYTYDRIMSQSTCSSVQVQQDFSNYWAPAMYHYDGQGSFSLMLAVFQLYYKFNTLSYDPNNPAGSSKRYAFPPGLTMIAGNRASRQVNASDWSTFASVFQCQRSNGNSPYSHDYRDFQKQGQTCDDGLRVTVEFPSCWDGVADNTDRTHMVYPNSNLGAGGVCPPSHPMATMQLTYEWYYPVGNFPFDPTRTDNWVLAFGDTSGFGMHSDFTMGWNATLLQEAVDQCADTFSNEIENCPPFAPWNGYQVPPCMASQLYPNEEVGLNGVSIPALPGCNPLWTDNSTKPTCSPAKVDPPISLRYGPDLSNWNYEACAMSATPAGLILWAVEAIGWTNMTVDVCLDMCAGYKYAMVTWGDNCYCDNEVKNGGEIVSSPVYTCFVHCTGDWSQICGGFGSANFYSACTGNDCFQNREIGPVATASLGGGAATPTTNSLAAVASAAHTSITCNWSDGRNYTLGGKVFQINCWENHYYGDLTNILAPTMEQCLTYCASYSGCLAAVWTPSNTVCWIKGAGMQAANTDTGEITGLLIGNAPASSAIVTSASPTSTVVASTIAVVSTTASTTTAGSTKTSAAVASASASAINCPKANGQTYTVNGKSFTVACATDHYGGDAKSTPGANISDCMTACSNYNGCLAVSWNWITSLCWIKTTVNPATSNNGVIAAVVNTGSSSSTKSGASSSKVGSVSVSTGVTTTTKSQPPKITSTTSHTTTHPSSSSKSTPKTTPKSSTRPTTSTKKSNSVTSIKSSTHITSSTRSSSTSTKPSPQANTDTPSPIIPHLNTSTNKHSGTTSTHSSSSISSKHSSSSSRPNPSSSKHSSLSSKHSTSSSSSHHSTSTSSKLSTTLGHPLSHPSSSSLTKPSSAGTKHTTTTSTHTSATHTTTASASTKKAFAAKRAARVHHHLHGERHLPLHELQHEHEHEDDSYDE